MLVITVLEISRPLAIFHIWPTKIQPNLLYIFNGTAINDLQKYYIFKNGQLIVTPTSITVTE